MGAKNNAERQKRLKQLCDKLEINLSDYTLLDRALTHPSHVCESNEANNQRLEFLGDAVVDLIMGEYLYEHFPQKSEGELTRMRAALVCEASLSNAAKRVNLGDYLLLGKGERANGGDHRASNLADAWEAVIAAIYLTESLEAVRPIMLKFLKPEMDLVFKGFYGDYKTQLQEIVQKKPDSVIEYKIIAEKGPDHDKEFTAQVAVNGIVKGQGTGKTKKEAEQNAALYFLQKTGGIGE